MAAVNREGAQISGGGIRVDHAKSQLSIEADIGRKATDGPIGPVRPIARVIQPHIRVERVNAIVEHPGLGMVFAGVVARNQSADRIIGTIYVIWSSAIAVLVDALDPYFPEVTVGIAGGAAEGGIVEVHSIG